LRLRIGQGDEIGLDAAHFLRDAEAAAGSGGSPQGRSPQLQQAHGGVIDSLERDFR
jgi:hypothetical protein